MSKLNQSLNSLPQEATDARIALMGVGNCLNSDDAVGVLVIRSLETLCAEQENLLLIEGGTAPEGFTSVLRRFQPHLVILIDACHLDQPAGTAAWVPWEKSVGISASSHTLPLNLLAQYIALELECQVELLGIQPKQLGLGEPTREITAAAQSIAAGLHQIVCAGPKDDWQASPLKLDKRIASAAQSQSKPQP